MKIKVDETLCEIHGQCAYLAPEIFQIVDDQLVYETEVDSALRGKVEKAAKACPQLAIRIED